MAKKKVNKNIKRPENSIDQTFANFIVQKIIEIENNTYYYLSKSGEKIVLGTSPAEAKAKLKSLIDSGTPKVDDSPSSLTQEPESPQPTSQDQEVGMVPVKNSLSNQSDIESKLLNKLSDIKPMIGARPNTIFVDGIDTNLVDHPRIKSLPFKFVWKTRTGANIDPEGHESLGGAIRFRKEWQSELGIKVTVTSDHTPDGPYFTTNEDSVYIQDLMEYNQRKRGKLIKTLKNRIKEKEDMQEFADRMGNKNTDPEQITQQFQARNAGHQSFDMQITKDESEIEALRKQF